MPPDSDVTRSLLRQVRWAIRRPIAQRPNGEEQSRLAGPGIEFAGVREYQPGDDVRRIDWQLTARSDRTYIREAHAQRALDVWLVVDVSSSVDWGTALSLKRERAVEIAAVAGVLIGRHGNRIGLVLFADQPLGIVPPGAGHAHLERVVDRIRIEPRRGVRGPTDLAAALAAARRLARRSSVLIVVSDFLASDGWLAELRPLARRHEVVAVRVRDPRESSLPDVGLVMFEDPETGDQLAVDTGDAGLRKRFHQAALAQARTIDRALIAAGVETLVLGTDTPLLPAVVRFLDGRRRSPRSIGTGVAA
jgi:uncharacterized protein (DUF58 family)